MCNNPAVVRKSILKDIFGSDKKEDLVLNIYIYNVRLERHKGLAVSEKKVDSLSQKYFSIPPEYRNYYPAPKEDLSETKEAPIVNDEELTVATVKANLNSNKRHKGADPNKVPTKLQKLLNGKKPPGRPKNATKVLPGQKSILKFVNLSGASHFPPIAKAMEHVQENEFIEF